MAASGSTGSARTGCPPSPETASKTCARSSPMSVPPAADRPPSRQSKPPCGADRMLTKSPQVLVLLRQKLNEGPAHAGFSGKNSQCSNLSKTALLLDFYDL